MSEERTDRSDAHGKLVQGRLGKNDGSAFAQTFYQECVVRGDPAGQGKGTGRRLHVLGFVIVLDDHRNAVQGAPRTVSRSLGIKLFRLGQSIGIHGDDRVQRRALLIVGGNARQVHCDQVLGGNRSRDQGCFNLR